MLKQLDIDAAGDAGYDLFGLIDEDESGSLDLDELTDTLMKMVGKARAVDVARVHRDLCLVAQSVGAIECALRYDLALELDAEKKILERLGGQ